MGGKSFGPSNAQIERANRDRAAVYAAIRRASPRGITRVDIARYVGINVTTVGHRLAELRDPSAKRVYIVGWCQPNLKRVPLFAIGNRPDVPRPKLSRSKKDDGGLPKDVERLARKDVTKAHEQWKAAWVPRMDPAAAWMANEREAA